MKLLRVRHESVARDLTFNSVESLDAGKNERNSEIASIRDVEDSVLYIPGTIHISSLRGRANEHSYPYPSTIPI